MSANRSRRTPAGPPAGRPPSRVLSARPPAACHPPTADHRPSPNEKEPFWIAPLDVLDHRAPSARRLTIRHQTSHAGTPRVRKSYAELRTWASLIIVHRARRQTSPTGAPRTAGYSGSKAGGPNIPRRNLFRSASKWRNTLIFRHRQPTAATVVGNAEATASAWCMPQGRAGKATPWRKCGSTPAEGHKRI